MEHDEGGCYIILSGIVHQIHSSFSAPATLTVNVYVISSAIPDSPDDGQKSQKEILDDFMRMVLSDLKQIKTSLKQMEEKQLELEDMLENMDTTLGSIKDTTNDIESTVCK